MAQLEKCLKVINIEQSVSDSQQILEQMYCLDYEIEFVRISTQQELERCLAEKKWNLVITDYCNPEFSSFEALKIVKESDPEIAFIFVSGHIGEESVVELMKAGAEDVVLKNRLGRIPHVIRRLLREHTIKDKEAISRRIANEAFAAKEQMLAIVSHDIKIPLSAIKLDAQMLLRLANKQDDSPFVNDVKNQINRLIKTTDRLKSLICDLLDKNKMEANLSDLIKTEEDPIVLMQDVLDGCKPLIRQKQIQIRTHYPDQSFYLLFDKNKLFQVISNLLGNAIKFTQENGIIDLMIQDLLFEVRFIVQDSGSGLVNQDLDRVFDKYWTGDASGTGLGLYICKTIVDAHGGFIKGENHENGGAKFWFSIPKLHLEVPENDKIGDHRKRIMVLDDDEDLREVISWALSREGYAVRTYRNPDDALLGLQIQGTFPHLILADYHVNGMKESAFLKFKRDFIQTNGQKCPVVIISASPEEVQKEISTEFYEGIITKPLDLEGMILQVRKYLA